MITIYNYSKNLVMKRKFKYGLLALILITLTFCSKNKEKTIKETLRGKWKLTKTLIPMCYSCDNYNDYLANNSVTFEFEKDKLNINIKNSSKATKMMEMLGFNIKNSSYNIRTVYDTIYIDNNKFKFFKYKTHISPIKNTLSLDHKSSYDGGPIMEFVPLEPLTSK